MRTVLIISICVIIFSGIDGFSQNKSKFYTTEETTLETSTGNISGTIMLPKKLKSQVPVILIIAGSGPTDRNGNNPMMKNNSLLMLAEGLAKNNIATLSYDKRGIADSKDAGMNEIDLRFENYIDDATAWIKKLKNDNRFNKIIIAGHSEGSLIGMIATNNGKADMYISIAGIGSNASTILKEQLKDQPDNIKDEAFIIIDSLVKGDTVSQVSKNMQVLFRKSVQPYLISWFKYEPQDEIKKLNIPILIIQGTTDMQVGVKEANLLKEAYPNAELQIIEQMNHVLKESSDEYVENMKTYYTPDIPIKIELIDIISTFINK